MFNVAIVGGENTKNYPKFEYKCAKILQKKASEGEKIVILSTGDKFNDDFAKKFHINTRLFITDWKKYGKDALKMRNEDLLKDCNAVIAFRNDLKDIQMITKMAVDKQLPLRIIQ
jgi:predicted transposase YbfD/YdcC